MARKPGSQRQSWWLGVALLGAVVLAAARWRETREIVDLAEHTNLRWLLFAVALQAGTYLAQGEVFRCVARRGHFELRVAPTYQLSLAKLFLDQALPSGGLSGTAFFAGTLERRFGMPRALVSAAVVVQLASFYAAHALGLGVGLVYLWLYGEVSELIVMASAVFMGVATCITTAVLVLSGPGERPRWLVRFAPVQKLVGFLDHADPRLAHSPGLVLETCVYQVVIVLLDSATLWVLIAALGARADPMGVLASFMLSSALRIIGLVPGGLGTFEAASVVTLRLIGVPLAAALAATLLFRGLSFWLPMLPGLWLSRRMAAAPRAA